MQDLQERRALRQAAEVRRARVRLGVAHVSVYMIYCIVCVCFYLSFFFVCLFVFCHAVIFCREGCCFCAAYCYQASALVVVVVCVCGCFCALLTVA